MTLIKLIAPLVFWLIFILTIFQIPYPDNITQITIFQLVSFFLPLFLALIFTLNVILKHIYISTSLSLGIIMLLLLKALESLNIVTTVLTVISTGLLISYFRKIKKRSLTKWPKIPKLTKL